MSMFRRPRFRRQPRLPAFRPSRADPRRCAELFGELMRGCREQDGRPLEELAQEAGMTPAEWEAMEAGEAPSAVEQVLWLARALNLGDSWLREMLRLCSRAAQQKP